MALFASEADIRGRLLLPSAEELPAEIVTGALEDAHAALLVRLDPVHDSASPPPGLIAAEALLAGAGVMRWLAAGAISNGRSVRLGGQTIADTQSDARWLGLANETEARAWDLASAYLLPIGGPDALAASDTQPVLGDA